MKKFGIFFSEFSSANIYRMCQSAFCTYQNLILLKYTHCVVSKISISSLLPRAKNSETPVVHFFQGVRTYMYGKLTVYLYTFCPVCMPAHGWRSWRSTMHAVIMLSQTVGVDIYGIMYACHFHVSNIAHYQLGYPFLISGGNKWWKCEHSLSSL